MKTATKYYNKTSSRRSGFTLIEMIGVLAVIAILAALLIPKIFEAINNARVNNAVVSVGTIKTAVADHYAKYGIIPVDGASATPTAILALPYTEYDKILLKEGFIDKPFNVKIGDPAPTTGPTDVTHTRVQVRAAELATVTPSGAAAGNSAYDLDGTATIANEATGTYVVEAVIEGVALSDARELNSRLDGNNPNLGEDTTSGDDIRGRVKYEAPASAGALIPVYIYMTHR